MKINVTIDTSNLALEVPVEVFGGGDLESDEVKRPLSTEYAEQAEVFVTDGEADDLVGALEEAVRNSLSLVNAELGDGSVVVSIESAQFDDDSEINVVD